MSLVEPFVKIENIVATAAQKHGIDLGAVVKAFPEVDYRPKRFPFEEAFELLFKCLTCNKPMAHVNNCQIVEVMK